METIGQVAARRIKEIRKARGWYQEDLARRLMDLETADDGRALNTWRVKVARTESGERKISVDEAFLFAAALGVSPGVLFRPLGDVAIAQRLELDRVLFDSWTRGSLPLRRDDVEIYDSEVRADMSPSFGRAGLREIAAGRLKRKDLRPEAREAFRAFIELQRRSLEHFWTVVERVGEWPAGGMPADELGAAKHGGPDEFEPVFRARLKELDDLQALADQPEAELPKKRRKKQ